MACATYNSSMCQTVRLPGVLACDNHRESLLCTFFARIYLDNLEVTILKITRRKIFEKLLGLSIAAIIATTTTTIGGSFYRHTFNVLQIVRKIFLNLSHISLGGTPQNGLSQLKHLLIKGDPHETVNTSIQKKTTTKQATTHQRTRAYRHAEIDEITTITHSYDHVPRIIVGRLCL
uniref:Uncharacterized protein n=1 Tax=Glossina brevipalpis TaxID=37001 RepID=A0A1A9WMD3_9MUSC